MPAAAKAAQASGIVFPRVNTGTRNVWKGTYKHFLNGIIKTESNAKPFAAVNKTTIDAEYQRQLQGLINDGAAVKKIMKERRFADSHVNYGPTVQALTDSNKAQSQQSIEYFTQLQKRWMKHNKTFAIDEDVRMLNFPRVFMHPKNSKYDVFDRQTYAAFAAKAEKMNPDVEFTKQTMDQAFTAAANSIRHKASRVSPADFERMMSRVSAANPMGMFSVAGG